MRYRDIDGGKNERERERERMKERGRERERMKETEWMSEREAFVVQRPAAREQFLQIFYNPALFRQSWVNQRMELKLQLKPGFSSDIKFQFPLSDRILPRKTSFVKIWRENYFWVNKTRTSSIKCGPDLKIKTSFRLLSHCKTLWRQNEIAHNDSDILKCLKE